MTLLAFRSFADRTPGTASQAPGWAITATNNTYHFYRAGRFASTYAACPYGIATSAGVRYSPPSPVMFGDYIVVGWARFDASGTFTPNIIQFSSEGGIEIVLYRNEAGALHVRRGGAGGAIIASGTGYVPTDSWYYLEVKASVADSGGFIEVKCNGVTILSFVGDTRNTSVPATGISEVLISAISSSISSGVAGTAVTDIYICNSTDATATQGSPFNDYLGDHKVETLTPSGNGSNSFFVGSDGNALDNYALVDELPSSSVDYVTANVSGTKDTYNFTNMLSATGVIKAVQVKATGYKTDSGIATIRTVTKVGFDEVSSSDLPLNTVASPHSSGVQTTQPNGSSWSIAAVNVAEFGYVTV